jgi:dynein heavy chain
VRRLVEMLKAINEKEASIEWDFRPLEEKYDLLQRYGVQSLTPVELEQCGQLRNNWEKLKKLTTTSAENLGEHQQTYQVSLVQDVKQFVKNVEIYRKEFLERGPAAEGISPQLAIERLNKHEREFQDLDRKYTMFNAGEVLFGMPTTNMDEMTATRKELKLLRQLYGLYETVDNAVTDYNEILWVDVVTNIESMTNQVSEFQRLCKNMPKALKDWKAYHALKSKIDNLLETIPLLQALSNTYP